MIHIFPVTQEYIDNGDRCSATSCPVALAGYDALPVELEVFQNRIESYDYGTHEGITYGVSDPLADWIVRFDEGEEVSPIIVSLDSGTQMAYIVGVTS